MLQNSSPLDWSMGSLLYTKVRPVEAMVLLLSKAAEEGKGAAVGTRHAECGLADSTH
jgi:hypothetical protein